MPQASLIVVNYNGEDYIVDCFKALEEQLFKDFEIILIDNGSSDGSLDKIRNYLNEIPLAPVVKLSPLEKNLGYAGGVSEGLRHAHGRYIALLNNDAEPDGRWLGELVEAMDDNPKIGICASKLIVYGTDMIDSAGDGFSTALRGFKKGEGKKINLYNKKEYIFGACAGAALYRRKMIDEIGFLDKDFFLIHEDTDLNLRAQLHDWKVMYVPTAIVYHKVRSSIGKMSDIAVYYTLRNSEFVRIKNIPFRVFIRCFPEFLIGVLTEFVYFAIKHKCLRLYFKAKGDAIRMLPRMLKKRNVIMRRKKVTHRYLLGIMTSLWQRDFLARKIKKFLCA